MNTTSAMPDGRAERTSRMASPAGLQAKNSRSSSANSVPGIAQIDGASSRLDPTALNRSGIRGTVRGGAGERRTTGGLAGLSNTLANRFPVVRRLLGDAFFKSMVRAYAVADPACSPVMLPLGESFPTFIDHFEPARAIPYLADMARLELARALARRAAVVASLGPDAFAAATLDRLGGMQVRLHPSLSVVASLHPIYSIWHMNRNPLRFTPASPFVSEAVLVSRPRLRVRTCGITHGDAAFIFALKAGYRLADAMSAAVHVVAGARPADTLAMLIGARAVTGLDDEARPIRRRDATICASMSKRRPNSFPLMLPDAKSTAQ
jgi:Putative DNA-binding domain